MQMVGEILVSALIVTGAFFLFVGSFGLAKLTDTMRRLHAPTKATTLGIGALLIASMVYFFLFHNLPTAHELMITLFLFLTAPITGHFIAKTHLHLNHKPSDLPPTGTDRPWASYESDAERQRIEAAAEAGDAPR